MTRTLMLIFAAAWVLGAAEQTFTGTISDSMCGKDHSAMKGGTDADCTKACVKAGNKYVLSGGAKVFPLSDQKMPEKFAGKRVMVTGSVDKAGVLQAVKMDAVK